MRNQIPFLTAKWLNLVMANYRVVPDLLQPFVPPGCHLDLFEGDAFVSLVAFDFIDTRVMGISWPGFVNFPEINLRFYVRHGKDHGICFIKELVQLKTVARIAHWIYNEPFAIAPVKRELSVTPATIAVRQSVAIGGKKNSIEVTAAADLTSPAVNSLDCFIKDQEWGFGTSRFGRLIRYQVEHPVWQVHPVQSVNLDWDWQAVYGSYWKSLQHDEPVSVMLVSGSAVKLFPRRTVTHERCNSNFTSQPVDYPV